MTHPLLTPDDIATYRRDGVVLVRGLFAGHVETLRAGVAANMADPGPYASENRKAGQTGRFFDDYCNWTRIPQFREVIEHAPAAAVAADLMGSRQVQMFHDHVLVKEPGTSMATPWHQDSPYYFVEGTQTVSFWIPVAAIPGRIAPKLDQHAAHERVYYEQLYRRRGNTNAAAQKLLIPETIELSHREAALLQDLLPQLVPRLAPHSP